MAPLCPSVGPSLRPTIHVKGERREYVFMVLWEYTINFLLRNSNKIFSQIELELFINSLIHLHPYYFVLNLSIT